MLVCVSLVHIHFTLIGLLFLALEAAKLKEHCTSTFLAANTNRGALLVNKNSDSNNINSITFEGLYLSSANTCGMDYQRCPNLTVMMDNNIVVVLIPLQEHLGLVTYDKSNFNLSFREKYVISFSDLYQECEISSISEYSPSLLTVIVRCLHTKANPKSLQSLYVVINSSSLTDTFYIREQYCSIDLPSEFLFLASVTFPMGITVFIDNGQIIYQRFSEDCDRFAEISVCSDVQRFTSVPPDLQAIYCKSTTYLLDLVSLPAIQTFERNDYGLPFFCSKNTYYTYKDGYISFHYTRNKTQIGSAIPIRVFLSKEGVVWGHCVKGMFVVLQLTEGKVISLTVSTNKVNVVGQSHTVPRIFGTIMLLDNHTHALVYELQTSKLVDAIKQEFMMGYVSGYDSCMSFSILLAKVQSTPKPIWKNIIAVLLPLLTLITFVSFGFGIAFYVKKRRRKNDSRKRSMLQKSPDNSQLDLADSNVIHHKSANGSGQPQCVAVDNPHESDLANSNMIHQESENWSGSCMNRPKSAGVSGQLVAGIFPENLQ